MTDAATPVETFFGIYAESLRNLGTPVLPLRFYSAIKTTFGDAVEISTIARPDGRAAARPAMRAYSIAVAPRVSRITEVMKARTIVSG